jgi:2-amino-4-hydroxy-6-hydroxymethyldihydropteridine diphosphokinase
VVVETSLEPLDLLAEVKGIEHAMGRLKTIEKGPRVIDIDILAVEGVTLKSPTLNIPHIDAYNRDFVSIPMRDIDPHFPN